MSEQIFKDEGDYKRYLEALKKYKEKYGFKLFSFALMPNQLNLLVELKEGSTISMVMHDITSSYTKYFNGRYGRKGHLFRERFKSTVVEKGPYLLSLIHYIHLRPVKLGLTKEPADYTFSSNLFYVAPLGTQDKKAELLRNALSLSEEIQEVTQTLSSMLPEKKAFADFVAGITKEEMDNLTQKLAHPGIMGSIEFIESVNAEIKNRGVTEEETKKMFPTPALVFSVAILLAGTVVATIYVIKHWDAVNARVSALKVKQTKAPFMELDSTAWMVELRGQGEVKSAYPPFDRVTFKEGKVASRYFSSEGFSPSNFVLTRKADGTQVWETMQRNAKGDLIFWRGEVNKEGSMKGEFSRKGPQGLSEEFAFTSVSFKQEGN